MQYQQNKYHKRFDTHIIIYMGICQNARARARERTSVYTCLAAWLPYCMSELHAAKYGPSRMKMKRNIYSLMTALHGCYYMSSLRYNSVDDTSRRPSVRPSVVFYCRRLLCVHCVV
jgi:hypothetical protein